MSQIIITCPDCSQKGSIEISKEKIEKSNRGIAAVHIAEKIICSHSFIAYVDMNMQVRDYFIADFKVDLPELSSIQILKELTIPDQEKIDVNLIKFNLHALLITLVLRAIFLKEKIVLINDYDYLNSKILNFFKYITQGSFEIDISIISSEDYKNAKEHESEIIFFDIRDMMVDFQKNKNLKHLKIEMRIVQRFFAEQDPKPSLIFLKNDVQKAYDLALIIKDYIQTLNKKEKIYTKKIMDYLENVHNFKISLEYLKFLIDIIKNYFKVSVRLHLANVSRMW